MEQCTVVKYVTEIDLKPINSLLNGRVIMNIYGLCSLVTRESKGNE